MRSRHRVERLHKLEQRFKISQELAYARLREIQIRMREEQDTFDRQRAEILKDGTSRPISGEESLLITTFLAISSPIWMMGLFVYNIYT